ncbi:MAG: ATP-binding protein [Rhizomicrobium sp.]|jgi:PAS domain S-box-containing protein
MREDAQAQTGYAAIVLDRDGTVLHADGDELGRRFIQTLEIGESILSHIHPEDLDVFELLRLQAPARPGRTVTIELRWARGPDRWSKLFATIGQEDDGDIRFVLAGDEAVAARRSEAQMRRVVEGSAQGIIVRTETEVLYMNNSFARLVGYASARECMAVAPKNANSMIHSDDLGLVASRIRARLAGEETVSNYEIRLLRRDGSPVWVEAHAALVNWDGQAASLSWLNDISRRKAIEAELVRSKDAAEFANRTKTEFLANMSHELRTPLNAILGFSEMIGCGMFGPIADKYVEYSRDIHRSGEHLLALVNDVLDLAKLEAGKLELRETEVCVRELVDECFTLLRNRADAGGVSLQTELPAGLPPLRADGRAVKQLLLNFLSNAVKFTPAGGQVTVRANCGRGLSISVSDTGIGMSESEIAVALSPFGQVDSKLARKHQGTGLGLPICKSLMQLHGGDLAVTSRPNEGTTLTARFPAERVVRQAATAVV